MANETKRFRIYTRSGDSGSSSLYTGQRLAKDHAYFQALGDVDELNSCIGLAREFMAVDAEPLKEQLVTIQSRLIDVGSALATPANTGQTQRVQHTRFGDQHTPMLEQWIDTMDDTLPPLKHFILPSGGHAAAFLHQARAVCRRAERSVIALARTTAAAAAAAKEDIQLQRQQQQLSLNGAHSGTTAAQDTNGVSSEHEEGQAQASQPGDGVELDDAEWRVLAAADVVDQDVRVYLNRLSDYLFTAARFMAHKSNHKEQTYQKAKQPQQ